jgi:type I restriction enzyme S subunit
MATWTKQKLGDVVEINCSSVKKNAFFDEIEYVDISAVGTGKLENLSTIPFSKAPSRARRIIKDGDTIISTVRPNRRSFLYIKNPPQNRIVSTGFAVLTPKLIDKRFLYYIISQQEFTDYLAKNAKGAAYPAVDEGIISRADVLLPDSLTQQKIGGILATYDDLIENNEKRIRILEEIAQRLYNEWFVKLKFPGHEKVKMVDSGTEYGMISEGWEVKKLGEIGKAITGKTPPTVNRENFNGEILFIKTPDIHGNIFVLKTEQTLSNIGSKLQSTKILPEKTVFVSCIGTLGIAGITSKPSQTNQQINALILNDKDDYIFFYLFAKGLKQKLIGLGSNGATMGNVNKDKFENILILYPKKMVREDFFVRTSDLFDEAIRLEKQKENLSKIRDLLIPQLATGKRAVK